MPGPAPAPITTSANPSPSTSPAATFTPPLNPGNEKKLSRSANVTPSYTLTCPPSAPAPADTITSATPSPVTSPVATFTPSV